MTPLEAARWANLAYENEDIGQKMASEWGFSFALFTKKSHQCLMGKKGDKTVFAFRGTEFPNLDDLGTNLDTERVEGPFSGLVHKGYYNAVLALAGAIKPHMKGEVYFTGHSMGGAMAVIAGAIFKPKAVYSFNAVKCGNSTFNKHYPVEIFRFVSRGDILQKYPPTRKLAHTGSMILLESTNHSMNNIVDILSGPGNTVV